MKRLIALLLIPGLAFAQPIPTTVNAKQSGAWTNACTQSGSWTVTCTDGSGVFNVIVDSSALPTGAATEATLSTLNGKITACDTGAIAGTVTCNAGTNLNTSALATEATLSTLNGKVTACNTGAVTVSSSALPSGASTLAEQQTQTASLSVLDDWDESDRAKVNPIVGQAGVAGGAGNTGATTQRVVAAADVGAPVSVNPNTIYIAGTAYTVKRAIVAESSSGDNEVVAAVTSKKIMMLSGRVIASAAVNAKWRSATTDIDGLAYLTANSGYVYPWNPGGWHITAAGEALNLNLSGAVAVGGYIQYIEAD